MGNFNRDNRGSGRSFGHRSFGGNRSENRQMYSAVCANCGKECQVPFKPSGEKPVYCSDCFAKMGGRDTESKGRPSFGNPRQNRPQGPTQQQFDALVEKVDKILALLEKPSN